MTPDHHIWHRKVRHKDGGLAVYYHVRFVDTRGNLRDWSAGTDLVKAKRERDRLLGLRAQGYDFDAPKKREGMTFSEWKPAYLRSVQRKRSYPRILELASHLEGYFGAQPLREISKMGLIEYKSLRLSSPIIRYGKPVTGTTVQVSTVNRELACLRHMLRLAAEEGLIDKVPSFRGVIESEAHLARERVLSREEERRLLGSSSRWLQRVIIAAVETALDRADLLRLTKEEVDWGRGVIKLRGGRTKTGVKTIVPILPRLADVLKEKWKEKGVLVFTDDGEPISPAQVRRAFEKAVEKAGTQDFRFKDLRHTAKTRWAEKEIPVEASMLAAGQKSVASHYRYVNLDETAVRRAFKSATSLQPRRGGRRSKAASS